LETEIKFIENSGTYKTFETTKLGEKLTMPEYFAIAKFPLGNLICIGVIAIYD
jgi:hypothetical protein